MKLSVVFSISYNNDNGNDNDFDNDNSFKIIEHVLHSKNKTKRY